MGAAEVRRSIVRARRDQSQSSRKTSSGIPSVFPSAFNTGFGLYSRTHWQGVLPTQSKDV